MVLETFGTFRSTYQLTSFTLLISMMYPHPKTIKRRFLVLMTLVALPVVIFVLIDSYNSFMRKDLLNLVYHSTVVGPYLGGVTKIAASLYMSKLGDELINEIDRDYRLLNTMPESYKRLARAVIINSWKYCEKCWFWVVLLSVATFPGMAMVLNLKGAFFDEKPQRHMVHDVVIPLTDLEYRFETPAYEIVFAVMVYITFLIMIYYIGYDAFFAISLNHACLKIDMYCLAFEDALKCKDNSERCRKLGRVVKEQLRLYEYVEKIQGFFNIYLGVILFAALIQIGTCLYHVKEVSSFIIEEFEIQYVMMGWGTICCIFYPCAFATKLRFASEESAVRFYCGGWEDIHCVSTRRTVLFVITRAQIPIEIKGFNWIPFNMDLFVSILKSAYSIYTLLCS
ncbi:uncharacterized protein LOC121734449 [Aricia agestis]|uniref:uncharacterized protein LOC121734449 n=1 Tax=Aricia agestis TaxID=91739 RepID=UPI001C208EFF|nr:uncharacterized protein LOC121734449 [Aricia agestis]